MQMVNHIMATEQTLQDDLDTLKADATILVQLVQSQKAQIAALSVQVGAGTPVSQDQLDALAAEAEGVIATLSPAVQPPPA
jgi:hypothetical protein